MEQCLVKRNNGWDHRARTNSQPLGTRPIECSAVSGPGTLEFRLRFVFPVVHLFPLVVSQYFNHVQLTAGPSQIRTCRFPASGSQNSLGPPIQQLTVHRDQVRQTFRTRQGMKLAETIEFLPAHIALLAPTAQMTFGHRRGTWTCGRWATEPVC